MYQATRPAQIEKSPGVKVKLLDSSANKKIYVLIFSKGDEVVSGLTEFALKYGVKSAHYSAIGDATSAKVGWYDYQRKMFKVIAISSPAEITSLVGDIAMFNGKPVLQKKLDRTSDAGVIDPEIKR